MRRRVIALAFTVATLAAAPAAVADPDFGPGNSSAGPNDANGHCHPPGLTVDRPGCK